MSVVVKLRMILCVLLLPLVMVTTLDAQQQPSVSLLSQFNGLINPSSLPDDFIQNDYRFVAGALYRNQWSKLSSAPRTMSLRAEYITNSNRTFNLLLGGYVLHDKAGAISSTETSVRIASIMSKYNPSFGGFSAGIKVGIVDYRIDTESLRQKYPNDILTHMSTRSMSPTVGIGVSYYNKINHGRSNESLYHVGISMEKIGLSTTEFKDENSSFSIQSETHYQAYAKFQKQNKDDSSYGINGYVRYVKDAPISIDLQLTYHPIRDIWFEVGSNSSGIGHVAAGVVLHDIFQNTANDTKIMYAYSPSFFDQGSVFGNTHEVSVTYAY